MLSTPAIQIQIEINSLKLQIVKDWLEVPTNAPPKTVQTAKWYMPETLKGLCKLWTLVHDKEGAIGEIGRSCFSGILLPACREDRHWGYVCDNTLPKSLREPNAKSLFLTALDRFAAAYLERDRVEQVLWPDATVIQGDAQTALSKMPSDCIDCIVTSPPYFGVADYVKAQRLTMEWLSQEIEPIRTQEIGARSKRYRTNGLENYISELFGVFQQVYRVMKPNAAGIIVFGQSPTRPDAQTRFVDSLRKIGFNIDAERQRQIQNNRRLKPSLSHETVIVIRK